MDVLEPHIALLLASLWGALTYPAIGERNATLRGWLIYGMIGTGCGFIFSPLICEWRQVESPYAWPAGGFVFGMLGVVICRAVIASAQSDTAQMVTQTVANFIRRVTGNEPPRKPPGDPNPGSDPPMNL